MSKLGRPVKEDKKITINITINEELNEKLDQYLIEQKLSKSEYIAFLIKKDKKV